ncbi:MAG TPA: M36 family metallopeptidase [Longimicrobium sp.]|nr:M36 family metallopeptidase [Longimicrobium sp.]
MKRIDLRDYSFQRVSTDQAEAAAASLAATPGEQQVDVGRVNPFTGTPERLAPVAQASGFADAAAAGLTGADAPQPGSPAFSAALIETAVLQMQAAGEALRATPAEASFDLGSGPGGTPPEMVPDTHVEALGGHTGYAVHMQQQHRGIPVFQMQRTVRFDGDGNVLDIAGDSVSLDTTVDVQPKLAVTDAANAAARYIAESSDEPEDAVDGWGQPVQPQRVEAAEPLRVVASFPLPAHPTVLQSSAFAEPVPGHLVLFYTGPDTRLGWHFVFTLRGYTSQYVVVVAADGRNSAGAETSSGEPEILYAQDTDFHFSEGGAPLASGTGRAPEEGGVNEAAADAPRAFRGNVFRFNPAAEARKMTDFPRPVNEYPFARPPQVSDPEFPRPWCRGEDLFTRGNNVLAVKGATTESLRAHRVENGVAVFDPQEEEGDEQKILNIFYFCNYMHNFFYMLGFDEASNFQEVNFLGNGLPGDAVVARAHPGPVEGTANMLTLADGQRALMNMGLVSRTNRHTALDADVVFHEFVHGVSNRLVGGRRDARGLQQPQSRGQGEGWSDYFALTVQSYGTDQNGRPRPDRLVTGDWVTGLNTGIRSAPYDENYPFTYGHVGTRLTRVHDIGEVWCATLMQMNRNLGALLGSREAGHELGWQLVVDGMKLTPANPSFLSSRDGILAALEARRRAGALPEVEGGHTAILRAVWQAFARFGMGPGARSVGASLSGIREDRSMPPELA